MANYQSVWLILLTLILGGCTHSASDSLPYEAWRLGFLAPSYMDVWIETADTVDIHDRVNRLAMSGVAAILTPADNSGDPRGWPELPGVGAGKHVIGADLPRLIYVRWQSLVEPQTYEAYIPITTEIRQKMITAEEAYCRGSSEPITDYRKALTIGLAPGGIVKAWVLGPCLLPIEVARAEATVYPKGPYDGTSGGKHRPLTAISKTYIEKHGIPFGSW